MSRKVSRRERRIRTAVVGTAAGLGALIGIAMWVDAARETDTVDPTLAVTSAFRDVEGERPPIRLRDLAADVGLVMRHGPGMRSRSLPEDTGSGLAWCDYDSDGDWDLYAVSFAGPPAEPPDAAGANRLFRASSGSFADVAPSTGVADLEGFGMGASFADFDGDGAPDLYVTNFASNRLFRNRGDGTFVDRAAAAGVDDDAWSTGIAWGDFDRDGALDLYVCNYVDYQHIESDHEVERESTAIPFTLNPNSFDAVENRLYRNLGDGRFEDVASKLEVDDPDGRSLAATMCDLDGDGWLDLYVNNDVSPNRLFRNVEGEIEGAPFDDISLVTGTADPRGSMGLSVGEIGAMDGEFDGLPDLFITHWVAQENALYQSVRFPGGVEYRDRTRRYRLGEISIDTVGWGSAMLDLDLDGRLDVAVANGSTLESKADKRRLNAEPLFLFWNDGARFVDVAPEAGEACSALHWGRGLAAADFDADGDVDLAICVNRGEPLLLVNETETSNHSLTVRLRGPATARFGAKVELVVDGQRQARWYGGDVSYLSQHAPDMVFGLGAAARCEELVVTWADGAIDRRSDVAAGVVDIER